MSSEPDGPVLRPRYARVVSPGPDCNVYDLALGLVLRAMFLAIFVIQAVVAEPGAWRILTIVLSGVWVVLVIDSIRRLRSSTSA